MHSLNSVLKFIDLNSMTVESFERQAKLTPGTINNALENSAELKNLDVNKIIARFGPELVSLGFIICSLEGWPGSHNDYAIIENDLNMLFFGDKK
ncbi:hypothetical protein [Foetidibacter luteolus]|uniref:hypothetical protein n=1 Tax=Foetidibacter luteolus TaxID=2608880 RepID=UPI00129B72CE|nr:hypothetical protein [Foetidibacter luteolus]